ncbi:hypothetical protein FOL47_006967 [Perkinsus chesapeaki]|uniref:Uncharacterized protein n=1 Tax=Perkinsus chesapeaki TaxID=330153 RepID=A0A7J6N283_PERCH|nr:hypothetical protein FOL47_006967 [Perkinsus chesapeaki]
MTTLAAEIRAQLKADRMEMTEMLVDIDGMACAEDAPMDHAGDSLDVGIRENSQPLKSAANLIEMEFSVLTDRISQVIEEAVASVKHSSSCGEEGELCKIKEQLARSLTEYAQAQQSASSRLEDVLQSLYAEVDSRIKKEVELVEASRVSCERAMLEKHKESINRIYLNEVDSHKDKLEKLAKDISRALEAASESNRNIDNTVSTIAERLEDTYREQIVNLRQEMEAHHQCEMEATANELQEIFSSEVCLLQEQLTDLLSERDDLLANLADMRKTAQHKVDDFVKGLRKSVEDKMGEASEDLENRQDKLLRSQWSLSITLIDRFVQFCESQLDKSAEANEAWDQERKRLLHQIRHLKILALQQTPPDGGIKNVSRRLPPSNNVAVKDAVELRSAIETTHELWAAEACQPSREDLLRVLSAIEHAALEGEDITDVYTREAGRLINRLPILKLIAEREYLICKRGLSEDGLIEDDEIKQIDKEILAAIDMYEKDHEEAFKVNNEEYRIMLSN